jgi:carbamoyl-phosphate synthase large subunit
MEIVYDETMLADYLTRAAQVNPEHPVLVDRFLDDAIEIDVDALYDGQDLYLGGVMEHIEEAGIHSGDSACSLPPYSLTQQQIEEIREATLAIAKGTGVRGLLNVQYAWAEDGLYVLEANPRASRTVPFVSKATGVSLAKAAARVAVGDTIAQLRSQGFLRATGDGGKIPAGAAVAVKEVVLPFSRFHGVDTLLGPEMKSTGEVMGIDKDFGAAFAKAQLGANTAGLPTSGTAFISVADRDKHKIVDSAKALADLGFKIYATSGTQNYLAQHGVQTEMIRKQHEGSSNGIKTIVEAIMAGEIDLVINTPYGTGARRDGYEIRLATVLTGIASITTAQGFNAAIAGIQSVRNGKMQVKPIQEHIAHLTHLLGPGN